MIWEWQPDHAQFAPMQLTCMAALAWISIKKRLILNNLPHSPGLNTCSLPCIVLKNAGYKQAQWTQTGCILVASRQPEGPATAAAEKVALLQAQLARQRALAASTALSLPDGGRRLASRIQQVEAELACLTASHSHVSSSTSAGCTGLTGPSTPIIDITSALLPATVLQPHRHTTNLLVTGEADANRQLRPQMRGNAADAIDLTGPNRSSGLGPVQKRPAVGPTHAIDLDAADSMPESSAKSEQATDISGLTEQLQQQLTIRPAAPLQNHHQGPCRQGSSVGTDEPCQHISIHVASSLLHSDPPMLTSLPRVDGSTVGAGRQVAANKHLSRAHVIPADENHLRADCPRSGQPGMLSADPQEQCSRSHPADHPGDSTHPAATNQVKGHAERPPQMQHPLSSITNVLHWGKPTATKDVPDQPLLILQKPATSQGIPKDIQHRPSAAHARATQQSNAGATQTQSQPECKAGGNAAQQCAQASEKAAWEAEVALLKRKLQKYCAILASERHRRELPDGGLKVVTQPACRASLRAHESTFWSWLRIAWLTIALP